MIAAPPEGTLLKLNGAHVQGWFFREVTLFALYTAEPVRNFETLLRDSAPRRVIVTILRPEFTAQRFRDGWREQFAAALLTETQKMPPTRRTRPCRRG